MNALVFKGRCHVAVEQMPVPELQEASDAIIKIDLCGLCGSDMHPYHGREQGLDVGTVMGHEFVGHVHQVGSAVSRFAVGDRVMSPFTTCCRSCFFCQGRLPSRCERGQLFGWREGGKGLHGAQAQYIRVPLADATLMLAPAELSDEVALLLGDIFSTGFYCAHNAGIGGGFPEQDPLDSLVPCHPPGNTRDPAPRDPASPAQPPACTAAAEAEASIQPSHEGEAAGGGAALAAAEGAEGPAVAVVGCGPVGLMAIVAARLLGASTIYATDSLPERLALARKYGAEPIDRSACDAVQAIRDCTGGRGADYVLELVGAPSALRAAYDVVRPGGVISAAGCHTDPSFPFTPTEAYNKNITFKAGRCPARYYMECLVPLVQGTNLDLEAIISHRLPLSQGVRAYELFDAKLEGCTKVVMRPWADS